jgi:hypothetical protein
MRKELEVHVKLRHVIDSPPSKALSEQRSPFSRSGRMHLKLPGIMSYIFCLPLSLDLERGALSKKSSNRKFGRRPQRICQAQKPRPSRYRTRKGSMVRDEVINLDSTHHAMRKIGQHVCSAYGGGTSIG